MEGRDRYPTPPPSVVGGGTWDPTLLLLPEQFPIQATELSIKACLEEGPFGGKANWEPLPRNRPPQGITFCD